MLFSDSKCGLDRFFNVNVNGYSETKNKKSQCGGNEGGFGGV
jgi:hypothetical protein